MTSYLMNEYDQPKPRLIERKYPTCLPIYDVEDADTGEILSTHIDMKEVVRRHGAIIEHLIVRRVAGFKEY